jgi:biopolymer transport protein ExbB
MSALAGLLTLVVILSCVMVTADSCGTSGTAASAGTEAAARGVGSWYARGGVFMHPLLVCALVGAIFILERVYTLNRARVDARGLMDQVLKALRDEGADAALKVCESTRGPVASVLHAGLMRASSGPDAVREAIEAAGAIEISFLRRGLVVISTSSKVAPMLGLLGTVSGAAALCAALEGAEQVTAKIVASGIQEALIPVIAGLSIAIPCMIGHSYCVGTIDRFVLEMEEASASLVNELVRLGRRDAARPV